MLELSAGDCGILYMAKLFFVSGKKKVLTESGIRIDLLDEFVDD